MSRRSTPSSSNAVVDVSGDPAFELTEDEARQLDEAMAEVERGEHVDAREFLAKLRAQR